MKRKGSLIMIAGVLLCTALFVFFVLNSFNPLLNPGIRAIWKVGNRVLHGEIKTYLAFDDERKNVGIYLDASSDFDALEERPEILAWFENWNGKVSLEKLAYCGQEQKAIPFITWQPKDIPLEEIVSGKHDRYITNYIKTIVAVCPKNDVLIRFAHEMDMRPKYEKNWYSWQGTDTDKLYKKAWIHVVTMGREIAPNIKWVWSPNRADGFTEKYYPGEEYVDYVGISLNHSAARMEKYESFKDFYEREATREALEEYGKKIFISEVSFAETGGTEKAKYITSVFDYYQQDPRIVCVAFFNTDGNEDTQYNISNHPQYLQIFYEGIRKLRM